MPENVQALEPASDLFPNLGNGLKRGFPGTLEGLVLPPHLPNRSRAIVHANGGGTQSLAIVVLAAFGVLPTPDESIIIDTGWECSSTWTYCRQHAEPLLRLLGVTLRKVEHAWASSDLYDNTGYLLIPAFTETGRLRNFCTGCWKRDVMPRYLRSIGYGPRRPVVQWLGYSCDEVKRLCSPRSQWLAPAWPLVSLGMSRRDGIEIVQAAGLPKPPRSRCKICPCQTDEEWRNMRDHWPDDFAEACDVDERIRERDTRGGVWLHRSKRPLRECPFDEPKGGQAGRGDRRENK